MSNVTISIAAREYTVACAAGEEGHMAKLGKMIDVKLAQIPGLAGQSESRTLLFAALLLADELHDKQGSGDAKPQESAAGTAVALEKLAEMLESAASRLESGAASA